MTKNPCRGCKHSWKYKDRHYPRYTKSKKDDKCPCLCEKYMKHKEYLYSRRKFIPGDVITTLEELEKQKWVIWGDLTRHISVIMNLQYRTVKWHLSTGRFRYAIRREDNATD